MNWEQAMMELLEFVDSCCYEFKENWDDNVAEVSSETDGVYEFGHDMLQEIHERGRFLAQKVKHMREGVL